MPPTRHRMHRHNGDEVLADHADRAPSPALKAPVIPGHR